MKYIILSADGDSVVYSVPDVIAENLDRYCMEFCANWLHTSPHAKKYRRGGGVCYTEADFIEYLNAWIFPDQQSEFIKNLGWIDYKNPIPDQYKDCPQFHF